MFKQQPSQPTTTKSPPTTNIRIGDTCYEIDVSKIPYLSSFVDFQTNAQPQSTQTNDQPQPPEFIHGPIPLFNVALKGIESGYRQCFRSLPADLSQHHILCETYDFLRIDVLGGQSINEIFNDLKSGQSDYDHEAGIEIRGDRSKARDAAFKLLYLILLGDFKDETRDSAKVFNAVLFLVSHAATFKWRTRRVVRAAYEERFVISKKQTAGLDKWEKKDAAKLAIEDEGDVTTEEEMSYRFYDSYSD